MKTKKYIIGSIISIVLMFTFFFVGSYVKEQKYTSSRAQPCGTFISFALDKVENGDIADQDIMEALVSNIYAAYAFCDDPVLQNQLHNLWNVLIFEGDDYVAAKDILQVELRSMSDALRQNQ